MESGQLFPGRTDFRKTFIFSVTACYQLDVLLGKSQVMLTVAHYRDATWMQDAIAHSPATETDKRAEIVQGVVCISSVLRWAQQCFAIRAACLGRVLGGICGGDGPVDLLC